MTNVYGTPGKAPMRRRLFKIGVEALEKDGWKVERAQDSGKSSLRRLSRGAESKLVTIRTTQDTWIAFPRDEKDQEWVTLSEVDAVVAVSVDDKDEPRFALVHMLDGDEMRDRFDRTYAARLAAGHTIPRGRGVWLSLYKQETSEPRRIGAGAGLVHPPIARVPLDGPEEPDRAEATGDADAPQGGGEALTIAEAKRRLALSLGVDESSVKITIEA